MTLLPVEAKPISLREYQISAVQDLRNGILARHRRQILVSPTGSGKTEMAMSMILDAIRKGKTVWFIVDRVTLIDQTSVRFFLYGIDHGIIQANHPLTDKSKLVQIVSAQTLARRGGYRSPDLIIWDECHCSYDAVRKLIASASSAKVIGLTATPFAAGMAEDWDGFVNSTTVNKLLQPNDKGEVFLAPLRIKACVTPDMRNAKKKKGGEYDDEDAGARGITIIGDVVQVWIEQTQKFFGRAVKTIVFSPSVKHGEEFCRQMAAAGFNFQQISYLDKDDDARRTKIEEFRKPDSAIDGLVSCAVLTKGFDVPDVLCGISCRPYRKSFSSHIQEMGRVMRVSPETGKTFGLWLCHSGNCISFAEDTAWLYEYGVNKLSDAAKKDSEVREPKEKVKSALFCSECAMQMQAGDDCCEFCGWERPKRGEIQFVQGELIDFQISTKASFQPRSGLRAQCLSDPRRIWNTALSYCLSHGRGDDGRNRKWAYGIWRGIYPTSKLPYGLYDVKCDPASCQKDEWDLVEREVKRFRSKGKGGKRAA